jgi:aryl-alcohol dehydrogenase-like predicted oxidoreductase
MAEKGLADYRLLGRSGLRVSPFALGAMGFGWWLDRERSRQIFMRYLDLGGNFVDTADFYSAGKSEEIVGELMRDTSSRDRVVLATKFSYSREEGNPNAGGNGRRNIRRAIEASLRRLGTEYVDLYYLHAWDRVTPIDEVLSTLNDLVREGKVLHVGLSNVPAWYVARSQTLAECRGYEPLCALQLEYSLVARSIEREYQPLARELGIGLCPFHPLALGLLSGRYRQSGDGLRGEGRLPSSLSLQIPVFDKFVSERAWRIVDELRAVSSEVGRSAAQVALRWVTDRSAVHSTLLGVSSVEQLEASLGALSFDLPASLRDRLDAAGAPEATDQDAFFEPKVQSLVHGKTSVRAMHG